MSPEGTHLHLGVSRRSDEAYGDTISTVTRLQISTEGYSDSMLTPHRRVQVGDIEVETPTTAIEIRRTRDHEPVHPDARGVNELYTRVSGEDLTQGRHGSSTAIADHYQRGYNKAYDDELTLAFARYDETGRLPRADAAYLVDVLDTFSDIIPVPLMPRTAGAVDPDEYDGIRDPAYRDYRTSVENMLDAVEKRAPNTPVMGTIPLLGWKYVEDLMDLYARREIEAEAAEQRMLAAAAR